MNDVFLDESIALLSRAPAVFNAMLRDLPDAWTIANEGPDTWNAFDVVGHLVHAEKADWMPRLRIILQHGPERTFDPFDREAQFRESTGKTLANLLDEFAALRRENLDNLSAMHLTCEQLALEGMHPALGRVTARQLLATWTAHDLTHIVQVSRVMAKRYKSDVGPWAEYLSVVQ